MLKINEVFFSIQGESSRAGWPTVFIRTSGCHLRCTYCDTTYAYHEGHFFSLDELISRIRSFPARHVCLTGGEPLLQKDSFALMTQLCDLGYDVSLETSGDLSCKDVDPRVLKVIDVKTPDSGAFGRFSSENLYLENVNSEFKFVICSEKDFFWAEHFVKEHNSLKNHTIFYSPSHQQIAAQWLAEKILATGSTVRLQLQLHKYIWSAETRGV